MEKAKEIKERNAERYATQENSESVRNDILKKNMKKEDKQRLLSEKKKEANQYLEMLRRKREENPNPRPKKNMSEKLLTSVDKRNSFSQRSDLLNDISTSSKNLPPFRKDYLKEIRQKGLLKHDPENKIESIIHDNTLSKKDREELLKVETDKIEQKLRYIEQ
mmetsp:Transcript_14696/g.12525  ORF Transcript_14696/g.12525 Transcript_14696/m.12525 type:complete len:163 (-) Transcript_14696:254-742(-)